MNNQIKHAGVMGMKWGHRKNKVKMSKEDARLEKRKELLFDALTKKKMRVKENVYDMTPEKLSKFIDSPVMKRKINYYEKNQLLAKRNKIAAVIGLTIIGMQFAGPSIVRSGHTVAKFARDKHADSILNKYGGHIPEMVVNAKVRDLTPIMALVKYKGG